MKIYKICFSCILLALLVAGCSDVKDANEKNFKAAAQEYLDTKSPFVTILVDLSYTSNQASTDKTADLLHVLTKLGLVKPIEKSFSSSSSEEGNVKKIYSYELTDEGKKFYKAGIEKNYWLGKEYGGFVFGKAKVDKIINFTEPTDYFGYKVSHVTYTYSVHDIPAWAKNADLLNLSSGLVNAKVFSQKVPIRTTETFTLTNNGWVHEKLQD